MNKNQEKWRLLIVDDEPAMAWFLADIAEAEGYQIEIAENGDEGVSKLEQGGYHAVLTDYRMPGRNGLDLIRFTRKHSPDLPLVMITGYATVENTVEAFHLGVFDLLEKPFDLNVGRALLQRLRKTLERQQQLRQRVSSIRLQQGELPLLVAESEAMQHALRVARALLPHPEPLLCYGVAGSGRTQLQQHLFQWLLSGDAGHLTQLLPAAEAASPLAALAPQATLAEVERFWIQQTLERHHGNRTQAAESLGINPSTLFRKLKNGAA